MVCCPKCNHKFNISKFRPDKWKHRLVKKLYHRAEKFKSTAITNEEKATWEIVQQWFKDILSGRERYIKDGVIMLSNKKTITKEGK